MFSQVLKFTAYNITLLAYLIMIANSVKIEQLLVPEVVQSDNTNGAILDCIYTDVSDQFTVQWLFNDSKTPVYEWKPHTEPMISGIIEGRLDLSYKPSAAVTEERRALRIISLEPELSGDYTCRVLDQGKEARQTKSMLVFSPEKDFALEFTRPKPEVDIKCIARGLFPQPEVILERNGVMFPKQQLRLWRSEGLLFDAESTAVLQIPSSGVVKPEQITCRLQVPQAGYIAIKKELLYLDESAILVKGNGCGNKSSRSMYLTFWSILLYIAIHGF